MIEKMSKITIVIPKEDIDNLLKVILKSKLLHLTQIDSSMYLNDIQEFYLKKEELNYLYTIYQDMDRFFLAYNKQLNLMEKKNSRKIFT